MNSNTISGSTGLNAYQVDARQQDVPAPVQATAPSVVPPTNAGGGSAQGNPAPAPIGEHTGPKAAIADLMDLRGSIQVHPDAAVDEQQRAPAQSDEPLPLPLEAVNPDDAQFQAHVSRYVQAQAVPTRAELQTEAKAYLDEQTDANESLVRDYHAGRRPGRPEPGMPPGGANNELAVTINRLVQTATLRKRYERSPLTRDPDAVRPLPELSEQVRFDVAKKALASLETRWQRDAVRQDGIVLALLGKTQDEWFAELKGQLAGKTMAQAKVIIKASAEAAINGLDELPKRAFTEALMDALDPLLNLLPDAQQQQFVWADDTHLNLRMGYQALRAADIPVESADEVHAAAYTIDNQLLSRDMASLAVECKVRDLARVNGDMPPHGLSDDAAVDSALARYNARPSALKDQQLAAMRAAMSDPPPSLREIAREYGRQYISGKDTVMIDTSDRRLGIMARETRGPRDLLDALAEGRSTRGADDQSAFFRNAFVMIEVESHLGPVGQKVEFSGEAIYQDYKNQIDEYYGRVERGVLAQLDLLIGSHRKLDSVLVPKANLGRPGEVKSPDNNMIVMLRSEGAQEAQPYKLYFEAGRGARLMPIRVSEDDVGGYGLDTPEKRAEHYVSRNLGQFFSRVPQQALSAATIEFDRHTGSPEELRTQVFKQLGWQQKIESARAEAKRSLQTGNPAIEALPLFGCVQAINDALRDNRPVNPGYDAALGGTPPSRPVPDSRTTGAFPTDAFATGLACFSEAFQQGAAFGGAAKLAGQAGAKAARSMINSATHRTARQVIVYRDLLKSGVNEFRQRLSTLGNSPDKVNRLITKLDASRYGHTIRHYADARNLANFAHTHTTDGSTLKPGTLPAGALVHGSDGRQYLKAGGGQAGGIFLHTDENNRRQFVRDIGTAEQPYYAPIDLNTRKIKAGATAFRPADSDYTASVDGKETRFYRRDGQTLVEDGGRLRKPTAREAQAFPTIIPRQAPVFYGKPIRPVNKDGTFNLPAIENVDRRRDFIASNATFAPVKASLQRKLGARYTDDALNNSLNIYASSNEAQFKTMPPKVLEMYLEHDMTTSPAQSAYLKQSGWEAMYDREVGGMRPKGADYWTNGSAARIPARAAAPLPVDGQIEFFRTMDTREAQNIAKQGMSALSGHMGDLRQAGSYFTSTRNDQVLVKIKMREGAHNTLFAPQHMAFQETSGAFTPTMHAVIKARGQMKPAKGSAGEGHSAGHFGVKAEERGQAFSFGVGQNFVPTFEPLVEDVVIMRGPGEGKLLWPRPTAGASATPTPAPAVGPGAAPVREIITDAELDAMPVRAS